MMTVCSPVFHHLQQQREKERETVRMRGCKKRERQKQYGLHRAPGSSVCSVMIFGVMNFQSLCIISVTLCVALTVSDFCPVSVR